MLKNLNWNWAGIGIDTAVAFLVCPYLVGQLGDVHYGAWVLIGSLAGYFGLMDLGIKGSVGRYVAYYHERNDTRAVSEVVNTALGLLLVAGLVGMLGTAVAAAWSSTLVGKDFAPAELPQLRLAVLLAGIQLMLLLPLNVFEGVLWGCQRFDHLNCVRIPLVILRGLGSVVTVACGGGLVGLAAVLLVTTLLAGLAKLVLAVRDAQGLRIGWRYVARGRVRELVTFGTWNSIRSLATMLNVRVVPLVVGIVVGVAAVTPLSIAGRLVSAVSAIVISAAGVVTPHATALHARSAGLEIERLLLRGSKYALAAGVFFMTLFLFLGRPLILAWVGPQWESAWPLLILLAAGRCFSVSQVVTRSIITAQARHMPLALAGIVQAVVTLGLGTASLKIWGVPGMVVVAALADAGCEGLFSLIYGCRLLGLAWTRYLGTLATAGLQMLPPSLGLAALVSWRPAAGWWDIFLYGAGFALVAGTHYLLVIERTRLWTLLRERGFRHALSH